MSDVCVRGMGGRGCVKGVLEVEEEGMRVVRGRVCSTDKERRVGTVGETGEEGVCQLG